MREGPSFTTDPSKSSTAVLEGEITFEPSATNAEISSREGSFLTNDPSKSPATVLEGEINVVGEDVWITGL